jgi:hypothetical protein
MSTPATSNSAQLSETAHIVASPYQIHRCLLRGVNATPLNFLLRRVVARSIVYSAVWEHLQRKKSANTCIVFNVCVWNWIKRVFKERIVSQCWFKFFKIASRRRCAISTWSFFEDSHIICKPQRVGSFLRGTATPHISSDFLEGKGCSQWSSSPISDKNMNLSLIQIRSIL